MDASQIRKVSVPAFQIESLAVYVDEKFLGFHSYITVFGQVVWESNRCPEEYIAVDKAEDKFIKTIRKIFSS